MLLLLRVEKIALGYNLPLLESWSTLKPFLRKVDVVTHQVGATCPKPK